MSTSNRAQIEAYIGASGSGKGLSIKRRLAELQPARLLIWDPRAEYGAHAAEYRDLRALLAALRLAGRAGPFRARYVPGPRVDLQDAFSVLAAAAFRLGHLVLLAEELTDITTPSWAPPAWRQIITQGRHQGLTVLGAAQRCALIDKTFLGNCTRIRCGQLANHADRTAMARELDCHPSTVEALYSIEDGGGAMMEMLELDRHARRLDKVTLTVTRGGQTTETRENIRSSPLRGGAGQLTGAGAKSARIPTKPRQTERRPS